jgi:hypothetical protein
MTPMSLEGVPPPVRLSYRGWLRISRVVEDLGVGDDPTLAHLLDVRAEERDAELGDGLDRDAELGAAVCRREQHPRRDERCAAGAEAEAAPDLGTDGDGGREVALLAAVDDVGPAVLREGRGGDEGGEREETEHACPPVEVGSTPLSGRPSSC